jgi:hypothetical protein
MILASIREFEEGVAEAIREAFRKIDRQIWYVGPTDPCIAKEAAATAISDENHNPESDHCVITFLDQMHAAHGSKSVIYVSICLILVDSQLLPYSDFVWNSVLACASRQALGVLRGVDCSRHSVCIRSCRANGCGPSGAQSLARGYWHCVGGTLGPTGVGAFAPGHEGIRDAWRVEQRTGDTPSPRHSVSRV